MRTLASGDAVGGGGGARGGGRKEVTEVVPRCKKSKGQKKKIK